MTPTKKRKGESESDGTTPSKASRDLSSFFTKAASNCLLGDAPLFEFNPSASEAVSTSKPCDDLPEVPAGTSFAPHLPHLVNVSPTRERSKEGDGGQTVPQSSQIEVRENQQTTQQKQEEGEVGRENILMQRLAELDSERQRIMDELTKLRERNKGKETEGERKDGKRLSSDSSMPSEQNGLIHDEDAGAGGREGERANPTEKKGLFRWRLGFVSQKGGRPENQDAYIVPPSAILAESSSTRSRGGRRKKTSPVAEETTTLGQEVLAIFGVLDGHGIKGQYAARVLVEYMQIYDQSRAHLYVCVSVMSRLAPTICPLSSRNPLLSCDSKRDHRAEPSS